MRQRVRVSYRFLSHLVSCSMGHPQPTSLCSPGLHKGHLLFSYFISFKHTDMQKHTHTHTYACNMKRRWAGGVLSGAVPTQNKLREQTVFHCCSFYHVHIISHQVQQASEDDSEADDVLILFRRDTSYNEYLRSVWSETKNRVSQYPFQLISYHVSSAQWEHYVTV